MRVLIPVEAKPNPTAMRERCRRFNDPDATIVLVHVSSSEEWADPDEMRQVREGLTAATRSLHGWGKQALFVVREGEPAQEIASLANKLSADVVLLPAR